MDSFLNWMLIFASTTYLLYLYLTRNFNYWKRVGLSGPKPMVGFGTIFYKMFKPMPILEIEWQQQFGNIYGLFLGNEPVLTVLEPELIKDILVKDFNNFVDRRHLNTYHEIVNLNLFFALGEQWRRIRAIMSPSFTNSKLKSVLPAMEVCVENTVRFMGDNCHRMKEIDMKQVLGNLTMDVIATTAFATKIESNIEKNNPFLINAKEFFNFKAYRYLAAFLLPKFILKYFLKSQFEESTNQFFINTSRQIIKTRKEKNIKNNDLIQLLMEAELREKDKDKYSSSDGSKNYNKKLTENEILAQCWVTFLAGYETTSTTLSFCIYELAMNGDIQDRLFDELWQRSNNGNDLSFDVINKCEYLEAVIFETLRKYPPVIRLERTASNDYKLANTGITIYKGQVVEIPIYAVHHCQLNFPKPDQFLPERFLPENIKQIKPHTFIPFGDGPRNCIGLKFALMEIKLVLSKLSCKFKFSISSMTQIPIKYNPVTPFLATNCNFLKVERRF